MSDIGLSTCNVASFLLLFESEPPHPIEDEVLRQGPPKVNLHLSHALLNELVALMK